MTIGSVNVNFKVCLSQGLTVEQVEMKLLDILNTLLQPVAAVVEFDVIAGTTETKVDPFVPAKIYEMPSPRQPLVPSIASRRHYVELPGEGDY